MKDLVLCAGEFGNTGDGLGVAGNTYLVMLDAAQLLNLEGGDFSRAPVAKASRDMDFTPSHGRTQAGRQTIRTT